jgi:hypothetical protein
VKQQRSREKEYSVNNPNALSTVDSSPMTMLSMMTTVAADPIEVVMC